MFSLLNESASFFDSYGLVIILLGALVILYLFSSFKNKDTARQRIELLTSLSIGDKVKTYSGIYGSIEQIIETTDGKVVLLKTGEGKKTSYVSFDINAIYANDQKSEIISEEIVSDDSMNVEVFTTEVKRPRGRPRKEVSPEDLAKAQEVKRPRGRPRKVDSAK